jgi:hypothetical protein
MELTCDSDVFMDNVNRDISMKMMIQAARRAIGRQYILITPQAMNGIQSVGDVKIIKYAPLDRKRKSTADRTQTPRPRARPDCAQRGQMSRRRSYIYSTCMGERGVWVCFEAYGTERWIF